MLPDRYEAGTPNGAGLAGLVAALEVVSARTVQSIRAEELALLRRLRYGLATIPGVRVYGPRDPEKSTAVVSLRIEGMRPDEIGLALDEDFGILTRVGLHCAPAAHRTMGTFPEGSVRLSLGYFTTADDIDRTLGAISDIATRRGGT